MGLTLKRLRTDCEKIIKEQKETIAFCKKDSRNPSIAPVLYRAEGKLDVAEALLELIKHKGDYSPLWRILTE
jgi:hypothetical protein